MSPRSVKHHHDFPLWSSGVVTEPKQEDDTIRRFRYLIGLTDLFRHFIDASNNPHIKAVMAKIDRENEEEAAKAKKGSSRAGGASVDRRRRTEQEEDAELLRDEKRGGKAETIFRESPHFVKNGEMRDYQVAGLNWLVSLHENGISGILAGEWAPLYMIRFLYEFSLIFTLHRRDGAWENSANHSFPWLSEIRLRNQWTSLDHGTEINARQLEP